MELTVTTILIAFAGVFLICFMKKVQATPEWKDYIEKTSQVDTFLTGAEFDKFIKEDLEHVKQVAGEQGWLVK